MSQSPPDEILGTYLADNVKARRMDSEGVYARLHPEDPQHALYSQACLIAPRK